MSVPGTSLREAVDAGVVDQAEACGLMALRRATRRLEHLRETLHHVAESGDRALPSDFALLLIALGE